MALVAGREGARRDHRRWIGWERSGGRTALTSDAHVRKWMEDEERRQTHTHAHQHWIRQWKLERSGIQDVNIFAISLKSRIQKLFVIKVLLYIPLISSAVVMYPLLWMHGCLVLTPMTLPGISSQFQEPHPGEGSREDFMKGWRIWGWCWMCVYSHVYSKSHIKWFYHLWIHCV